MLTTSQMLYMSEWKMAAGVRKALYLSWRRTQKGKRRSLTSGRGHPADVMIFLQLACGGQWSILSSAVGWRRLQSLVNQGKAYSDGNIGVVCEMKRPSNISSPGSLIAVAERLCVWKYYVHDGLHNDHQMKEKECVDKIRFLYWVQHRRICYILI